MHSLYESVAASVLRSDEVATCSQNCEDLPARTSEIVIWKVEQKLRAKRIKLKLCQGRLGAVIKTSLLFEIMLKG